jgi:hypothetical protein
VADCCEHGNEPSGFIKGEAFLGQLSDCQFLNLDCLPWTELVSGYHCCSYSSILFTAEFSVL